MALKSYATTISEHTHLEIDRIKYRPQNNLIPFLDLNGPGLPPRSTNSVVASYILTAPMIRYRRQAEGTGSSWDTEAFQSCASNVCIPMIARHEWSRPGGNSKIPRHHSMPCPGMICRRYREVGRNEVRRFPETSTVLAGRMTSTYLHLPTICPQDHVPTCTTSSCPA